jgi:hypothetical protein
MLKSSLRSMIALAGAATLSTVATASSAADLTRDDEISIRGDIVAADSNTRMIVVDSSERDTLGYRVLPNTGDRTTAVDVFTRLRPGVTIDMRYYRIIDVMIAKSTPEVDAKATAMLSDPAQAPGILDTGRKVKVWKVQGMVVRTDLAAKKIDVVDPQGGMVYRTPWIKSKEGQATLATLKPGDAVTCIFSERTAFEVNPIN